MYEHPVAVVTGASSGLGLAMASHLSRKDFQVFGLSRTSPVGLSDKIIFQSVDVNDCDSVARGIETIVKETGRIDLLINCAGFGIAGAIEDTTLSEAKAQLETNFFGTVRLCREVLPIMRRAGQGLIINVSSLAGLTAIPFQGFYSASKFAIEGYTEALRMEVTQFGIKVVLLEPGDFKTGFTQNRQRTSTSSAGSAYQALCDKAVGIMERDEQNGPPASDLNPVLDRILRTSSPRLRYSAGNFSQRAGVGLKRILPYGIWEMLLKATYGLR